MQTESSAANSLRSWLTGLRASILRQKYHWFLVVLMAGVIPLLTLRTEKPGEFYPFSNFPMYSTFEPETYYVYVTGGKGEIVPISPLFGRSISDLKKTYDRKLSVLKKSVKGVRKINLPADKKTEAARDALQWLLDITPAAKKDRVRSFSPLSLHEVQIKFRDSKIGKDDVIVGTLPVPP